MRKQAFEFSPSSAGGVLDWRLGPQDVGHEGVPTRGRDLSFRTYWLFFEHVILFLHIYKRDEHEGGILCCYQKWQ